MILQRATDENKNKYHKSKLWCSAVILCILSLALFQSGKWQREKNLHLYPKGVWICLICHNTLSVMAC